MISVPNTPSPVTEDADLAIEDSDALFEEALFEAHFSDLPAVKAVRDLIAARGYGDRDPLNILVEICAKFESQLTTLTTRHLNAAATMQDAVNNFRSVMNEGGKRWDAQQLKLSVLEQKNEALTAELIEVTEVLTSFIPPLNKAGGDVVRASEIIQEKSTQTVIIRWASLVLMFLAGFFAFSVLH